jgi:hypothetical protein
VVCRRRMFSLNHNSLFIARLVLRHGSVCDDDDANDVGRTIRLGRMPSVRRKRRKRRNVGDRRLQGSAEGVRLPSDATLHRGSGDHLVALLNPACITIEILAHEIRICGSTRTNQCRTANSNSLRNNLLGRFGGVLDGAVRRIALIISSASLEIEHKALLVSCHFSNHYHSCPEYREIRPPPKATAFIPDLHLVYCSQYAPRQVG